MRNNKNLKTRWILVIAWMAFIFIMSQMPGDKSSEQSRLVILIFSFLGIDLSIWGELGTYIVRKGAHFTEYFILYILAYRLLLLYYSRSKAIVLTIFGVFFYACSDEFHQWFIEGRVAAFKDVLIDTFGGIFGSIVMIVINNIKNIKSRGSKI